MTRLFVASLVLFYVTSLEAQQPQKPAAVSTPMEVLLSKARAMEGRGRLDLAAQTWQQVLMADPNQTEALAGLARYATQSGNPALAKTYTDRLRKLDPNHPAIAQVESTKISGQQQARLQEAARLVRNQQMEHAVEIYREVFGDNPPPGGWAIAYYEALASTPGGWEAATAGLEKLMRKFPQSMEYRLSLGILQTYRPATRLSGMRMLESVEGNSLLVNKARQAWRQALVWEEQNPAVVPALRAYLARYPDPELRKIEAQLPRIESAAPAARNPEEDAGYTALQAGNVKEAEAKFEAVLKTSPQSSAALSGLGFVRMKQEDFAAAEGLFAAAKAEAPDDKTISDALEGARFWKVMKSATGELTAGRQEAATDLYRQALTLRPDNPAATQGLAGALLKAGNPKEAEPLFEKLAQQQPQNTDLWRETLNAKYQSGGAAVALAFAKEIPDTVQFQLGRSVEYHALMAAALSDAGRNAESKQHLQEGIDLANARNRELSVPLRMQFAGLFLRHGYLTEAATLFRQVTALDAANVSAWEGLLTALVQNHQEAAGMRATAQMPKPAYTAALLRPGFLRSLSAIEMTFGRLDNAEEFLRKSLELEGAVDTRANTAAQLQLAQIWFRKGQPQAAEKLLRRMQDSQPDNPDVWKTLISVLHQQGRDEDAMVESNHLPPNVKEALNSDADYTNILVSALSRLGQLEEAMRLARRAAALLKQQGRPVPADLQIQTAWLLLNTQGDERELYSILSRTGAQTNLTREQEQSIQQIWTIWALRRSQAATSAGDLDRSVSILEAAAKLLPGNPKLQSALAGNLLKTGDTKRALNIYLRWGMRGATASDYTGAVGAAMAQKEDKLASVWLQQSLQKWPGDGELLALAGKQAAAAGDYKRAQSYWKSAVTAMHREESAGRRPQPGDAPEAAREDTDPVHGLGQVLLDGQALPEESLPKRQPADQPVQTPRIERGPDASDRVIPVPRRIVDRPSSERRSTDPNVRLVQWTAASDNIAQVLPRVGTSTPAEPPATPVYPASPKTTKVLPPIPELLPEPVNPVVSHASRSPLEEVQDALANIQARNTPSLEMGGSISGRSGEPGFERLLIQRADLEASAVIGDRIRMTVIARPTYLDAGTPDGQSTKRFGLLPEGSAFAAQSVGGVGGEIQIATKTFGLRLGATPSQFAVQNVIGGIRFRPGNGPITLLAERENVVDSLVSYAGARDPITNRVWGGVVANSVSAIGNWGSEKSGFYAAGGVQYITGRQVEKNKRVDGNAGAYWRALKLDTGSLTVGFNLTAMHYDKNLQYYTLGQGGYFSPQRYLLFNIPAQWRGSYRRRLQYVAAGSLGSQHFEADATPYFPTLAPLQGRLGQNYPSQAVTGANYSVDVRIGYQMTPHLYLGGWVNMNNARNYTSDAAGIYLRYSFQERPLTFDSAVPSVPDWRGIPLFIPR